MMFRALSAVLPQIGVKNIDPNDISSIPEEVGMYVCLLYLLYVLFLPCIMIMYIN